MDSITVGDQNCKFEDIANIMEKSPVAEVAYKKLGEIFRRLDVNPDIIFRIRSNLCADNASYFESVVRGLESWRAKFGTNATLSKLVFALQQCGLNDIADVMKSTFCQFDPPTTTIQKLIRIPTKATLELGSSKQLIIIKTTSKILLYEWIGEPDRENTILVDCENLPVKTSENFFIVTTSHEDSVNDPFHNLRKLDQKFVPVAEERINEHDTVCNTQYQIIWKDSTKLIQLQQTIPEKPLHEQSEIKLSLILSQIDPNILEDDMFLTNLISCTAQIIPIKLPPVPCYYIGRRLIPRNRIDIKVFRDESKDTFVFTGLTRSELSAVILKGTPDLSTNQVQKPNLSAKFIILVLYSDFRIICSKAKAGAHWLHYRNGELTWVASKGTMSEIQKYVIRSEMKYSEEQFIDIVETEQIPNLRMNAIILSDSPGMGKSVLLVKLATTISQKFHDRIVIFVRFEEFFKQHKVVGTNNDLFETFVTMTCNGNKLSEAVLKSLSTHQENNCSKMLVEIFIDGFDEVVEKDRNAADDLLTTIQNKFSHGSVRLWVTTRPHLLNTLENLLNVLGFNIEPFLETEQLRFFESFWTESALKQGKTLDETRLNCFGVKCLTTVKNKLGKQEKDIAGIPLQCLLIAEAYSRNAIDHCNLSNVIDEEATPVFNIQSITDLYKHLIETKLDKYCNLFKIDDEKREQKRSELMNLHIQISLDLIFPGIFTDAPLHLNSIDLQDLIKVGIVESSEIDSVPRFIHRTFAEYFTAVYIVDSLYKVKSGVFEKKLLRYLFNTTGQAKITYRIWDHFNVKVQKVSFKQTVICFFIDNLLAKKLREGKQIPLCSVNIEDRLITATISEDFISLFQFFKGYINWIHQLNSKSNGVLGLLNPRIWGTENDIKSKIRNNLFLTVRYSRVELMRLVFTDFWEVFKDFSSLTLFRFEDITMLHVAVRFREFEVVKELMDNWTQNLQELNSLVYFCISETLEFEDFEVNEKVEILYYICLKIPILLHTKFKGLAPLHFENVHPKLESKLLALGADINVLTDDGGTILHKVFPSSSDLHNFLCKILHDKSTKSLCQKLILVKDKKGYTPLHTQLIHCKLAPVTLKIFHDLGADFNSVNNYGDSIIKSAIKNKQDKDGIRFLIDYRANINLRGKSGGNLFHVATHCRNVTTFEVLIEKGLDVNLQDKHGNTSLHDIFRNWSPDSHDSETETIASLLVRNGVNLDIKNINGYTAIELCLVNTKRVCGVPIRVIPNHNSCISNH